jgi:hypothetical protein
MESDTWPAHAARAVATITNAIRRAITALETELPPQSSVGLPLRRCTDEWQQRDTNDARADCNQRRRREGIASNLDCRIPPCVAGNGEQDGREDERR